MPGINEAAESSETNPTEPQRENVAMDVNNELMSTNESSEEPPKEVNQTDKINKFLLRSFLQHINNQQADISADSTDGKSTESDSDWK